MRMIDVDALINEIKKETEKAIKQDDGVGAFWFGYFAGLVLEQPTIQPVVTDTISRQSAIDALRMDISIIPFAKAREYVREAIETIYNRLEELPSAQPERKKGRWISLDDFRGKYNEYGFKCSECDEHSDYEENFCPNCGADLRGEQDE